MNNNDEREGYEDDIYDWLDDDDTGISGRTVVYGLGAMFLFVLGLLIFA